MILSWVIVEICSMKSKQSLLVHLFADVYLDFLPSWDLVGRELSEVLGPQNVRSTQRSGALEKVRARKL